MHIFTRVFAGATLAAAIACGDATTSPQSDASALADAFVGTPLGYSGTSNSFGGSDSAWTPGEGGRHGGHEGHGGRGGPMGAGDGLMGGGLGLDFAGGVGAGRGFDHGPFGGALPTVCTFTAATGRVACDPVTSNGITIVRSAAYTTAAGVAQSAPDSTTNTINLRTLVSGTIARTSDTTTVQNASDRTVSGLAAGSTQRTVNGSSSASETRRGTSSQGHYVATRTAGDTTTGVVVPIVDGRPTYPTAGTVVRAMSATVTFDGQAAQTSTRREVITYDGSSTAKVVITQDGATKSCTLPLPHGRLTCS
jgi:hypothetical protein